LYRPTTTGVVWSDPFIHHPPPSISFCAAHRVEGPHDVHVVLRGRRPALIQPLEVAARLNCLIGPIHK
jgi:hypothetical protein